MGWYEAIKDGVQVARNAGNIELSLQLATVADDLLEKQKKIEDLEQEVKRLKEKKKYKYEDNHTWLVDPTRPDIKLCPVCLNKNDFENPMIRNGGNQYCSTCQKVFK